jgi:ABC-type branched-subunit amino acid transport system permease subunit
MVIAGVVAAAVGAALAVPALRLGGIYLALATLAFAFMFDSVLEKQSWVRGSRITLNVPRPSFATSNHAFFLLTLVLLAVVGVVVILIRNGTTGHYLDALRGSETAATAIGINPARARIVAFALSAGIAGLGGGLLAIQENQANYTGNFQVLFGLLWLVIVVTIGARTVEGAVQAGLAIAFVPEILKALGLSPTYQFILFGLGAVTYAKHPEGILEYNKRKSLETVQRWLTRGKAPRDGTGGEVIATRPEPATVGAGNPGQRP